MALSVYKKGQGTAARGISAVVVILMAAWATYQMWMTTYEWAAPFRFLLTGIVVALFGAAPMYLILFHHQATDLLIETQQEMRKVSWSSREELFTSTVVVIITVALLSMFINLTDRILLWLAQIFGVY